jgi:hypothetical protein
MFMVCLLVLAMIVLGYQAVDDDGWIPHREETTITAQSNWFQGESKDCISNPLDPRTAQAMKKPEGYAMSKILCDDGPEHVVRITFYGRLEQPQHTWVAWRCTRNSDSFTCKQTANSPSARSSFHQTVHGTDNKTGRPVVSQDGGRTWEWTDQ